jgi:hypothetical protein
VIAILSVHPVYMSALILAGVTLALAGIVLFKNARAIGEASTATAMRTVFGRLILRFEDWLGQSRASRTRAAAAGLMLMGMILIAAAIASIWYPQCGTVFDLPPCH